MPMRKIRQRGMELNTVLAGEILDLERCSLELDAILVSSILVLVENDNCGSMPYG